MSRWANCRLASNIIDSANSLGLQQCIPLFQQNLQQEEAAAKKLAALGHQLGQVVTPNAFPLDLFGFERYTFPAGGGWSYQSFSTPLRVLKLSKVFCIDGGAQGSITLRPSRFIASEKDLSGSNRITGRTYRIDPVFI